MIKTAPRRTLSPQMWCIKKKIKDWFARTQIYSSDLLARRLFFGCTYKAISSRYKICFTPKSLSFSLKSECALTLTDLWNTKLLFDLSYEFINGSFAFSCG